MMWTTEWRPDDATKCTFGTQFAVDTLTLTQAFLGSLVPEKYYRHMGRAMGVDCQDMNITMGDALRVMLLPMAREVSGDEIVERAGKAALVLWELDMAHVLSRVERRGLPADLNAKDALALALVIDQRKAALLEESAAAQDRLLKVAFALLAVCGMGVLAATKPGSQERGLLLQVGVLKGEGEEGGA